MATDQAGAEQAPPIIERFMRQLVIANKAVGLYPPSSTIPRENAAEAVGALNDALEEFPEISLVVTKQGLYFDDKPIFPGQSAFASLATDFYNRRLALVRFHSGVTAQDLVSFLSVLKSTPEEVAASGGYEAQLWEHGIGTITVVETQVTLINQRNQSEASSDELENDADVQLKTSVQVRAAAPRSREHVTLARVLGDDTAVKDYLTLRLDAADAAEGDDIDAMFKRFTEFSRMMADADPEVADRMARMFADALWSLEPELREQLLGGELLPAARSSQSLAGAIRRLDLEEMLQMLSRDVDSNDERRLGFIRALANLVHIRQADRESVARTAKHVLQTAGASGEVIDDVIAKGVPTKLTVRPARPRSGMDGAAALVLDLIEQAPLSRGLDETYDPDVLALRDEAAVGVTESDVIATLVALAGLESREAQFANTMSTLEDALDALVARDDIEAAADAAISLVHAAENPELTSEQVRRLQSAVTRFARPDDIHAITHALRTYSPGQREYDAAQLLLTTLGALAVRPLLEQLAEEPDRAERKALVDLLSREAPKHIPELSAHVGDPRWYFVRNVVAILGSTKSPAILSAMERTLRHSEPRVRRETIRTLSMVQDRVSIEMLISALQDEDAHNVQLAARYLGVRGVRNAVPALEMVATGEGRGNRENGPRVEAIEALGRIGAVEALPTLQSLARKRALLSAGRAKEIRTAAESAVSAIMAKGGA